MILATQKKNNVNKVGPSAGTKYCKLACQAEYNQAQQMYKHVVYLSLVNFDLNGVLQLFILFLSTNLISSKGTTLKNSSLCWKYLQGIKSKNK